MNKALNCEESEISLQLTATVQKRVPIVVNSLNYK